jgi:hypothetical protein
MYKNSLNQKTGWVFVANENNLQYVPYSRWSLPRTSHTSHTPGRTKQTIIFQTFKGTVRRDLRGVKSGIN